MVIFTFQSVLDYTLVYIIVNSTKWYKRNYVYKCESEIRRDMLTYMEMHAGPEYPFYYQPGKTIIVVLVCIVFGSSMPMLFLMAMVSLSVQYLVDRWTLAYFYRLPPPYSDKLTLSLLNAMSVAPIVSLSILFWQYTNKQMFDNRIDKIQVDNEARLSHHHISELEWQSLNTA